MTFHRNILFLASLIAATCLFAQDKPVAEVSIDKNKVLIGEIFQLRIQIHFPQGTTGGTVSIDSIPHFEFAEKPVIDSSTEKGARNIKAIYKLTSFDSGRWVIPSFVVSQGVKTDTIPVDVVFSDFDPNQEYHDIKDILDVKPSKKKMQWWWYAIGAALLLAALIYYLSRKKKLVPVLMPKSAVNPYDEAMKHLEQLQREKPEAKQYYSRLTDIFRLYIFRKKGILSLQKTTDDMVLQLRNLDMGKEQFDKLAQSLRLSDFVKFAKYIPTSEDDKSAFEEIKKAIITIEKSEAEVLPSGKI